MRPRLTQQPPVVGLPESEPDAIVGYVFDAIGRKKARFAGQTDAEFRAAMARVNFDLMPPGWFVIMRKTPRP